MAKRSNNDKRGLSMDATKRAGSAAKVATARTLWVPAVNNHGGFGRWGLVEIADPWNAQDLIRAALRAAGAAVSYSEKRP